MRVCVLSSSHAAALKEGYDALDADAAGRLNITFFASRQNGLHSLRVRNRTLFSANPDVAQDLRHTSGGKTEIDPHSYDLVVIHALGLRYQYDLYRNIFHSQAFIEQMCIDHAARSLLARTYGLLQQVSAPRVVLSAEPYRAASDEALRQQVAQSSTPRYMLEDWMTAWAASLPGAPAYFPQPRSTIVDQIFTHTDYSSGSRRLDVNDAISGQLHPAGDHGHMNAKYGVVYWREFLARFAF